MFEYSFNVKDVQEINFNRILTEQKESGQDVSLITSENGNHYVLVHNDFLNQFHFEDGVTLNGYNIHPVWGDGRIYAQYQNKGFVLVDTFGKPNQDIQDISKNGRVSQVLMGYVKKLREELAVARAFIRKIKVNVHSL